MSELTVSYFFIENKLHQRDDDQCQHRFDQIHVEVFLGKTDQQRGKRHAARCDRQIRNKTEKYVIGLFEVVKSIP